MITATSLIAVLMQVISIIFSNPSIPQDVKDQVFTQITQAIQAEQGQTSQVVEQKQPEPILGQSEPIVPVVVPVVLTEACQSAKDNVRDRIGMLKNITEGMNEDVLRVDRISAGEPYKVIRRQEIRDEYAPRIKLAEDTLNTFKDIEVRDCK